MSATQSQTGRFSLIEAVPTVDPSNPLLGRTITRLRAALPTGSSTLPTVIFAHD